MDNRASPWGKVSNSPFPGLLIFIFHLIQRLGLLVACLFFALPLMAGDDSVQVGLVFDDRMSANYNGGGHPESPQRLQWIRSGLEARGIWSKLVPLKARLATDEELLRVHTAKHLEAVGEVDAAGKPVSADSVAYLGPGGRIAARISAGGAIAAADAIMAGTVSRAFCAVRPPGHHAGPEKAEGFCYFNNVAVVARHLQAQHQLERVLILDWDVHAGNGTYAIFKADPTVFDVHIHQDPRTIYPGTGFAYEHGEGAGLGYSANFPLPIGSDGAAVLRVLDQDLRKICATYKPEFILISAGFDMHQEDPLGSFTVTDEDYAAFTRLIVELAETYCEGRVLSVLEGGYSEAALTGAVSQHVNALFGNGGEKPRTP